MSLEIWLTTGLWPGEVRERRERMAEAVLRRVPDALVRMFDHDHKPPPTPSRDTLWLVGHSFGGDTSISWCERLGRQVDALVLLDPVPRSLAGRLLKPRFAVPSNVGRAVCFHRESGVWPFSKRIYEDGPDRTNVALDVGHADFYDAPAVLSLVDDWLARLAVPAAAGSV